jgi:hypothetical protein
MAMDAGYYTFPLPSVLTDGFEKPKKGRGL